SKKAASAPMPVSPAKPKQGDLEGQFAYGSLESEAQALKRKFRQGKLNAEEVREQFYSYLGMLSTSAPSAKTYADDIYSHLQAELSAPEVQQTANAAYQKRQDAHSKLEQAANRGNIQAFLVALDIFGDKERKEILSRLPPDQIDRLLGSEDIKAINELF